jgi:hypothetical protein
MEVLNLVKDNVSSSKVIDGLAVILAYTMLDPLMEDVQDTFGKSLLYHPMALWICMVTLVYTQTSSLLTGVIIVIIYESVKAIWRTFTPEPPVVGQIRKLLHRVQNGEKLSDNDISFLDKVTPPDVKVQRKV